MRQRWSIADTSAIHARFQQHCWSVSDTIFFTLKGDIKKKTSCKECKHDRKNKPKLRMHPGKRVSPHIEDVEKSCLRGSAVPLTQSHPDVALEWCYKRNQGWFVQKISAILGNARSTIVPGKAPDARFATEGKG